MHTIQSLVDMVASDAHGAGLPDHYFDESRDPAPPVQPEYGTMPDKDLPAVDFELELVRQSDGTYRWME